MNPNQWITLFALIEKVVNLPDMTANEKAELLKQKAEEQGATEMLDEFSAYVTADL